MEGGETGSAAARKANCFSPRRKGLYAAAAFAARNKHEKILFLFEAPARRFCRLRRIGGGCLHRGGDRLRRLRVYGVVCVRAVCCGGAIPRLHGIPVRARSLRPAGKGGGAGKGAPFGGELLLRCRLPLRGAVFAVVDRQRRLCAAVRRARHRLARFMVRHVFLLLFTAERPALRAAGGRHAQPQARRRRRARLARFPLEAVPPVRRRPVRAGICPRCGGHGDGRCRQARARQRGVGHRLGGVHLL